MTERGQDADMLSRDPGSKKENAPRGEWFALPKTVDVSHVMNAAKFPLERSWAKAALKEG